MHECTAIKTLQLTALPSDIGHTPVTQSEIRIFSHLCGQSITSVRIAMYHGVSLMFTAVLLVLSEAKPATINGECKLF